MRKVFSSFLILLVVLTGCSSQKQTQCCQECIDAFGNSPVAMGESAAQCGQFTTGNPLLEECENYFKAEPQTVQECQDKLKDRNN
jgi:hypothetical protein